MTNTDVKVLPFRGAFECLEGEQAQLLGPAALQAYLTNSQPPYFQTGELIVCELYPQMYKEKGKARTFLKKTQQELRKRVTKMTDEMEATLSSFEDWADIKHTLVYGYKAKLEEPVGSADQAWVGGAISFKEPNKRMLDDHYATLSPYDYGEQFIERNGEFIMYTPLHDEMRVSIALELADKHLNDDNGEEA